MNTPPMRTMLLSLIVGLGLIVAACGSGDGDNAAEPSDSPSLSYRIVDSGQELCYDASSEITCPDPNSAFFGQDAQYQGNQPDYIVSDDQLTVHDNVTDLTWQRSPDTDGDATLSYADKLTISEAQARPAELNETGYGGYRDWRLPTIKELYSLFNAAGSEPAAGGEAGVACGAPAGTDTSVPSTVPGTTPPPGGSAPTDGGDQPEPVPFIDTDVFEFSYGFTDSGERAIDAQYASSTLRTSPIGQEMFGVNFADGRIKSYGTPPGCTETRFFVLAVRGNTDYGENDFVDNGDGTITDRATGLTWARDDSKNGMNWQQALAWVQEMNDAKHLGHDDWRLPNGKELQSILDYSRQTDATGSAATDPLFTATAITNEEGEQDYPFYWSSTSHGPAEADYLAFGRGLGYLGGAWIDVHGSGTQRGDPKQGDASAFPTGRGPQGDAIRITNYVRLVRG